LPFAYIIRQLEEFRLGLRRSADWRKENTPTMIKLAQAMTGDEIKAAAAYFSAIEWSTPWVRVVETDLVPRTRIGGNRFVPLETDRTEPIAGRIIEVSDDRDNLFHGQPANPRAGWIAYVPVGSIARGEDLVTTGGVQVIGDKVIARKTLECTSCHGPDLMGTDDIPPIAGRSPSYMARQLYDIQQGTRIGRMVNLMSAVVANLTEADIVAITAYVASRPPRHSAPVASPGLKVINTSELRPQSRSKARGTPLPGSR
jgi:cytochrome c553